MSAMYELACEDGDVAWIFGVPAEKDHSRHYRSRQHDAAVRTLCDIAIREVRTQVANLKSDDLEYLPKHLLEAIYDVHVNGCYNVSIHEFQLLAPHAKRKDARKWVLRVLPLAAEFSRHRPHMQIVPTQSTQLSTYNLGTTSPSCAWMTSIHLGHYEVSWKVMSELGTMPNLKFLWLECALVPDTFEEDFGSAPLQNANSFPHLRCFMFDYTYVQIDMAERILVAFSTLGALMHIGFQARYRNARHPPDLPVRLDQTLVSNGYERNDLSGADHGDITDLMVAGIDQESSTPDLLLEIGRYDFVTEHDWTSYSRQD
ncbi:Hypothetical protein D9617_1g082310 [Elsinoe fawcettii]|nr:Hypothetical protein D9617_1g082310 [Elsinoe fawcettii]